MANYAHSRYYKNFLLSLGRGLDPTIESNLGSIYRYKGGLYKHKSHFISSRRRRGLGFGSFFSSLFQRAAPLLRTLGTKTIDLVSNIAKDSLAGEPIKNSSIKHIQKALPEAFSGLITRPSNITKSEPFTVVKKRKKSSTILTKQGNIKLRRSGSGHHHHRQRTKRGTGINQLYPALSLIHNGEQS